MVTAGREPFERQWNRLDSNGGLSVAGSPQALHEQKRSNRSNMHAPWNRRVE